MVFRFSRETRGRPTSRWNVHVDRTLIGGCAFIKPSEKFALATYDESLGHTRGKRQKPPPHRTFGRCLWRLHKDVDEFMEELNSKHLISYGSSALKAQSKSVFLPEVWSV